MNQEFALSAGEFGRVRQLIAAYSGISLHEHKQNMVYNRLARRLRATGAQGFAEYLDRVETPGSEERERFVNALTTNLTAFFREPHHFDALGALARQGRGAAMRVWSCACSTGEEAYSAAIVLREAGRAAEIVATDIDTEALAAAQSGVYRIEALERMDAGRLRRNFLRGAGANEGRALVRPELKAVVRFEKLNLLAAEWPSRAPFDAVFCRNVMIYFNRATQLRLLDRIAAVLGPGGMLFLGHSESCAAAHPAFRACGKTAYERRGAGPAQTAGRQWPNP